MFNHIFPLKKKKEENNQLKRANRKDGKDTGIIPQRWGDHWLVEELIMLEDIPTVPSVPLSFDPSTAVSPFLSKFFDASKLRDPTVRLGPNPDWR